MGILAVMGIVATQTYWVMNTWDLKEEEFHEKVSIALRNVADEFKKLGKNLPNFDLINQVSTNYYVVNVNDEINANNLQYFLRREMEEVGLNEDFEYGIYDCATNQMVYGSYIAYRPEPDTANINQDLPTFGQFEYYFGVRFPDRQSWILSNIRPTVVLSVVLLLTLLFFLYAMWIILRHQRLSEMHKDFIINMTHEFKTPISTIGISADTFIQHPAVTTDTRLARYANIIKEQSQRLDHQVEKVLQIARIERDNFKLNREPLNLHTELNGILNSVALTVSELGGTLRTELDASRANVHADQLHLNNILHNLLDNAIKYSPKAPDVRVRTTEVEGRLQLEITDRGVGIDKEHQTKVFNKFYRVPTGDVHDVKGFGLGLFYVRNICHAHGWKIRLESEPGVGTTVTILF